MTGMTVTAEVVAKFTVPRDTPLMRLGVSNTLKIPLHVAPTAPGNGWEVEADFLTYQSRITMGEYHLPPLPYKRNLNPIVDTRRRVVLETLAGYNVGRGVPGTLEQIERLADRLLAALDNHNPPKEAS